MPLEHGSSRRVISDNIKTERAAGKPERVAVAIAESEADRSKLKHPNYNETYRPTMTSDKDEKLSIKGVKPEHLRVAVAKLAAPRKNSSPMAGTASPGLRKLK
jgi:hypothetical protein